MIDLCSLQTRQQRLCRAVAQPGEVGFGIAAAHGVVCAVSLVLPRIPRSRFILSE